MTKRIQDAYQEHMHKSSPDMDKLWDRIDKRIDASAKADEQQKRQEITQAASKSSGIVKFIALTACLAAVVAGTVVFMSSKENEVKTDTTISAKGDISGNEDNYKNAVAGRDKTYGSDNVEDKAADAVSSAEPKAGVEVVTKGKALDAEKAMKDLKQTDEFIAADLEHRMEMVTKLAEDLKEQGAITDFKVKKREKFSRIEMDMPDGTLIAIMLE